MVDNVKDNYRIPDNLFPVFRERLQQVINNLAAPPYVLDGKDPNLSVMQGGLYWQSSPDPGYRAQLCALGDFGKVPLFEVGMRNYMMQLPPPQRVMMFSPDAPETEFMITQKLCGYHGICGTDPVVLPELTPAEGEEDYGENYTGWWVTLSQFEGAQNPLSVKLPGEGEFYDHLKDTFISTEFKLYPGGSATFIYVLDPGMTVPLWGVISNNRGKIPPTLPVFVPTDTPSALMTLPAEVQGKLVIGGNPTVQGYRLPDLMAADNGFVFSLFQAGSSAVIVQQPSLAVERSFVVGADPTVPYAGVAVAPGGEVFVHFFTLPGAGGTAFPYWKFSGTGITPLRASEIPS